MLTRGTAVRGRARPVPSGSNVVAHPDASDLRARRRFRGALVVAAVSALTVVSLASAGGVGTRKVTVYSVATGLQYINTEDDRARGRTNNPLDSAANKLWPKSAEGGNGPFAGDVAVYAVKLFREPGRKRAAGSGVYTCYFNYDQHALCKAYYKLADGGTLVAAGPIDFDSAGFTIVVTGGTQKYLGARGQLDVVPSPKNTQRLDFELIG